MSAAPARMGRTPQLVEAILMAKHRAPGDEPLTGEEASDSPAYWSVDDFRWAALRPDLPTHLVDLLAPPIVVGVARVPATSRLTPPGLPDRSRPAVAPRRPVAPAPTGRHRRVRDC